MEVTCSSGKSAKAKQSNCQQRENALILKINIKFYSRILLLFLSPFFSNSSYSICKFLICQYSLGITLTLTFQIQIKKRILNLSYSTSAISQWLPASKAGLGHQVLLDCAGQGYCAAMGCGWLSQTELGYERLGSYGLVQETSAIEIWSSQIEILVLFDCSIQQFPDLILALDTTVAAD